MTKTKTTHLDQDLVPETITPADTHLAQADMSSAFKQ